MAEDLKHAVKKRLKWPTQCLSQKPTSLQSVYVESYRAPHILSFMKTWAFVRFRSDSVRCGGLDLGVVYHKTLPGAVMLCKQAYLDRGFGGSFVSLLTGSHESQADLECLLYMVLKIELGTSHN